VPHGATCSPINGTCGYTVGALTNTSCSTEKGLPGRCTAAGDCIPPCIPLTCNSPQYAGKCGSALSNGCGSFISCECSNPFATCKPGDSLGPGTCVTPCAPKTCADLLETYCGTDLDDGCGGKFTCTCANAADICMVPSLTAAPPGVQGKCKKCIPKTCSGTNCFSDLSDGCGGRLSCNCTNPTDTCSTTASGVEGTCKPCQPFSCFLDPYVNRCGSQLSDNCGGTIAACGCSRPGTTCSAKGVPGVVGDCTLCVPRKCTDPDLVGKCVSNLDDGCGGKVTCGCDDPNSFTPLACNASTDGVIGSCVCKPRECGVDFECGVQVEDGCGGRKNCTCKGGLVCSSSTPGISTGVCVCTPKKCSDFVGAGQCGVFDNGCGQQITCGCTHGGQSCSGSGALGAIGTCSCTAPLTCSSPGYANKCGSNLPDNCGGTLNCSCSGSNVCSAGGANGIVGNCRSASCTGLVCWSGTYERKCGTALNDGCGATMDCGCPEGQACTEGRPGQLGICYTVDCPFSQNICGTSEKFGKCGVNLDSGCPGVPLNCPCANPSHVCPARDGQLAVCHTNPRGTDGACVDVPAIPSSINNADKAAVTSLITSNYLPYQSCFLNGYTDPGCCNLDAGFPGSVDSCLANPASGALCCMWLEYHGSLISLTRCAPWLAQHALLQLLSSLVGSQAVL